MRILDALEKKINRHSYDTWLKPTRYSHASGGVLFVRVPTAEFRHAGDVKESLLLGDVLDLAFTVDYNTHPDFGGVQLTLTDFAHPGSAPTLLETGIRHA